MMNDEPSQQREYWSSDGKFGVVLLNIALSQLLQHATESSGLETGGIAMGRYSESHSYATIDHLTGPPVDSHHGSFSFVRGVRGLQAMLTRIWAKERRYYLGEWHYHPFAPAEPSQTDLTQMRRIATDSKYACPEPLLLILGGNAEADWELRIFLTLEGRDTLEVFP